MKNDVGLDSSETKLESLLVLKSLSLSPSDSCSYIAGTGALKFGMIKALKLDLTGISTGLATGLTTTGLKTGIAI